MLPEVVNVALVLIPFPPPVPPVQLAKTTGQTPVKTAPMLTPWQVVPVPPEQLANVTVPVVAGVQAAGTLTPWEEAPLDALLPPTVMIPEVLVIEVVAVEIWTPGLVPDPPETVPVMETVPVVVRILPPLK